MIAPRLFPPADPLQLAGPRLELRMPSRWIFRLPRPLKSPNRFIWRSRWALAAEREAWEREMQVSLLVFAAGRLLMSETAWQAFEHLRTAHEKRAVRIWRLVPSARNFFQDVDNCAFAAKNLVDAMVRVGLLKNDNRTWLERGHLQEVVSDDGQFWTVIQLDARPDVRAAWRS